VNCFIEARAPVADPRGLEEAMFRRARELALIVGILWLSVQGLVHSARRIETEEKLASLAGYQPSERHP
jgi:hypothetical protein